MAVETVEIVHEHIEAFRHEDVARALSSVDLHVVLDRSRISGLESMDYGHEALAQAARRYVGAFEGYDSEVERLTDPDPGAVLVVVTEEGRGRSSGIPVRQSFAALYTVIDGKIVRITLFPTRAQAIEAAGLEG